MTSPTAQDPWWLYALLVVAALVVALVLWRIDRSLNRREGRHD